MSENTEPEGPQPRRRGPGFQPGHSFGRRWQPGQSGNPGGRPRVPPKRSRLAHRRLAPGRAARRRDPARSRRRSRAGPSRSGMVARKSYGRAKLSLDVAPAPPSAPALEDLVAALRALRATDADLVADFERVLSGDLSDYTPPLALREHRDDDERPRDAGRGELLAVASAPGAASVRVWPVMSRGRDPRGGRAVPEGANVASAPPPPAARSRGAPTAGTTREGGRRGGPRRAEAAGGPA